MDETQGRQLIERIETLNDAVAAMIDAQRRTNDLLEQLIATTQRESSETRDYILMFGKTD